MNKKHSYTKSIIVGTIFLVLLISSFSNIGYSLEIDQYDGTWTDTFTDDEHVTLSHCDVVGGSITLKNESDYQTHDFKTNSENKAYSYKTSFFMAFLPPNRHIPLETEFGSIGYAYIKKQDNDITSSYSTLLKNIVVQHFRFKINQDSEPITQLDLYWRGKAENDRKITMYFWQPVGKLGRWQKATNGTSDGTFIDLESCRAGDLFISEEGHVDICIVAASELGKTCMLSTDYVKITAWGRGYVEEGSAVSALIFPTRGIYLWERLTFEDFKPSGTSIKYHILNESGVLIDDSVLPGNTDGFTSPISLSSIPNSTKIKIQANLTTIDTSVSPKIYSWSVTWQTVKNTWEDRFSSVLRIDEKENVHIVNQNVSIITFYNDWAMFGQNPANTRSSDGQGPSNNELYWYSSSASQMGGGYRNPIIKDGVLYVASLEGDKIYALNATVLPGDEGSSNLVIDQINIPSYIVKNSPVATDDLVVIATGNTSSGGVENKIYAFDRNNLTSEKWRFEYKDIDSSNPEICYSGSPVVSDNKIFISTWSGDDSFLEFLTEGNNKIIALTFDNTDIDWSWCKDLPAGSFCSPAVSNDRVIVGCENAKNDSLFAFNIETGQQLWSASVGAICRASPVVYDDKVFVVAKEQVIPFVSARTKVFALSLEDGSVLWNVSISNAMFTTYDLAASTPAVYNDVLFVASPDGTLYALDIDDGEDKWSKKVYTKGLSTQVLVSSPAYADGMIYIGTPDGVVALRASNGNEEWKYYETEDDSPVLSSPIVVDGLIYFSDENGILYSLGSYQKSEEQQITGSLTSIPILLPQGHMWDVFYAVYDNSSGGSIVFSILDEGKNTLLDNVQSGDNISSSTSGHTSIRLRAIFTVDNSSEEVALDKWAVTTTPSEDTKKPVFYEDSFTPSGGWIATYTPTCTIVVRDVDKGLLVSSARFTLKYKVDDQSTTETYTATAQCTGSNSTTSNETISVDISALNFSENITELVSIEFYIEDIVGNSNSFTWDDFNIDDEKPSSYITNGDDIPDKCNTASVIINATAEDNTSSVDNVALYYRTIGANDWTFFASDDSTPYGWSFSETSGEYEVTSGEYEFCSIATDAAGNKEDFPDEGNISFIFDPNAPDPPEIPPEFDDVYWFNSILKISIGFSDDFKLDTIEYKPNFEVDWTLISSNISKATYTEAWKLSTEHWEYMQEGEAYYLYFRITDVCGNQYVTPSDEAIEIRKDTSAPYIDLGVFDFTSEWQWDDVFNISVSVYKGDGSNIKQVQLYYRYSEDNETWTNWSEYNDEITSEPFEWEFKAKEGNGYYQFKIVAEDVASNSDTLIVSASASIFPMIPFVVMLALMIVFLVVTIVLFLKWRRSKA